MAVKGRDSRSQYDEGDGTSWETLRKGPPTAEFSCPEVSAERQFWDLETVVWASPGEAGWDVAIWPYLWAGGTTPLLSAGLSHISDTPASLSKAFSGGRAVVQLFLCDPPLALSKCFLISNLSLRSFNLCLSLAIPCVMEESRVFSSNPIILIFFSCMVFLDL